MACVMIFSIVLSSGIESKAVDISDPYDDIFYVNYQEPGTTEGQGYFALLLKDKSTGKKILNVYSIFHQIIYSDFSTNMLGNESTHIYVGETSIRFVPMGADILDNDKGHYTILCYNNDGTVHVAYNTSDLGFGRYSYDYGSNYEILGWLVKGDIYAFYEENSKRDFYPPRIVWGPERSIVEAVSDLATLFASNNVQLVQNIVQNNTLQSQNNQLQQESNDIQKQQHETSKGIFATIKDFFGGFFGNLVDSIVSIFVPSGEEMSDLFNELNQFFSDTFGFLYYPFDFLVRMFQALSSPGTQPALSLPGFSIMGYEVWSEQSYILGGDKIVGDIFGYVRIGTGVLLSMSFVMYLRRFFDKKFGSGSS